MAPEKPARRLGRGLDALFNAPGAPSQTEKMVSALQNIPTSQISSNPFQPRNTFLPEELQELEESLRVNGLLQPLTVRPAPKGKGYELIAGERRLRAAMTLGWTEVPAIVKEMADREMLTLALVENLQRLDLNPIDEAQAYERLIRDFGHTQQTIAEIVGKDRSTVANVIRILQLPSGVRTLIEEGKLTAGQARPLLGLDDPSRITALARQIVEGGLSAREVERRVREVPADKTSGLRKGRPKKIDARSPELRSMEQRLRKHLQTDVSITLKQGNRGSVIVDFYSPEDLERLVSLIGLTDDPQ